MKKLDEERDTADAEGGKVTAVAHADPRTQAKRFEDAARELGCDEDEDRFKKVLQRLARKKL